MLTKTDFMLFLDAPLHLWAKHHGQIEAQTQDIFQQHLAQQGQQVEDLAEFFLIDDDGEGELSRQRRLVDGSFEARLDYLLHDLDADVYDLYEVKSSTSLKKEHEYDLAFQALVSSAKLPMRDYYLVLVNKDYVRQGEIDPLLFFRLERLTDTIKAQWDEVSVLRQQALIAIQQHMSDGLQGCTDPNSCPCPELCHPNLPPFPIYDLPRLGKKALELQEKGVIAIEDIPDEYPLSDIQRAYADLAVRGKPQIDISAIQKLLTELKYPLYFLDYETVNPAIPLYNGYHPYDLVVFQYSLHVIEQPGDELKHYDCLVLESVDPAPKIARELADVLGPQGSILVWNKSFESRCNHSIANQVPAYADFLEGVNARLFDLMDFFSKRYYMHPDFHGSTSLKFVLPVLAPEFTYENLEVKDGSQAMVTWWELVFSDVPSYERYKKEKALLAYCAQDTMAMVVIWRILAGL